MPKASPARIFAETHGGAATTGNDTGTAGGGVDLTLWGWCTAGENKKLVLHQAAEPRNGSRTKARIPFFSSLYEVFINSVVASGYLCPNRCFQE